MSKDPNYIAKLEKAITQKYGEEAINNPACFWDENKEKEYIQQSVEERQKFAKLSEAQDKVEEDGFLISLKLASGAIYNTSKAAKKDGRMVGDQIRKNKNGNSIRNHPGN